MEMKKRVTSIFILLTMLFVQFLNVVPVEAAEESFSVDVVIQSYDKILLQGKSALNKPMDAIKDVLKRNNVQYATEEYISQVGDIAAGKFGGYDGWLYSVNRKGNYPDSPWEASFLLEKDDKVILYYGDMVTSAANKISYSTKQPNTNLTITLENSSEYTGTTPIQEIKAIISKADNSIVFNEIISNNKINLPQGLQAGSYKLELSDFQANGIPKVVADTFVFTIESTTEDDTDNNPPSDSLYDRDNTNITKDIKTNLDAALNYIKANSAGDPWSVLSLNKLGVKTDTTFIKTSAVEVMKNNGLKDFSNTELEKLILVLTSSGYSPYSFMGYNLVSELYNRDIDTFLINDAVYGLLAMNFANIDHEYNITKEKLVKFILDNKLTYKKDNADITGWTLAGDKLNPDITGLVINSLSPMYKDNPEVRAAVDAAVNSLSLLQNQSGYIADNFGYFSESLDMVILGLTSIGIEPDGDKFTKTRGDLVSALLSYKGTEGRFKHSLEGENDYIATEQALRAFIALKEFEEKGKYDYYSSNIDSSKLTEFSITDKELLELGYLPQTGGALDFTVIAATGIILVFSGLFILKSKSLKLK
jgi:hypothetical protein